MSDDKSYSGRQDRDRINLNQDDEVRGWSKSLGVTEDELRSAVRAVGNTASKVRDYFWQRKGRLRSTGL